MPRRAMLRLVTLLARGNDNPGSLAELLFSRQTDHVNDRLIRLVRPLWPHGIINLRRIDIAGPACHGCRRRPALFGLCRRHQRAFHRRQIRAAELVPVCAHIVHGLRGGDRRQALSNSPVNRRTGALQFQRQPFRRPALALSLRPKLALNDADTLCRLVRPQYCLLCIEANRRFGLAFQICL